MNRYRVRGLKLPNFLPNMLILSHSVFAAFIAAGAGQNGLIGSLSMSVNFSGVVLNVC